MAYKALYRTYRPEGFDEMAGQEHIIKTLKNAVNQNKIAHAYLFCGPRGTGKTSAAKIFAKAVNCTGDDKPCGQCESCLSFQDGNHPDIIEIDAASNNGVEEVRNLIDKVKYAPIMGNYKIYIIDEVHMMSQGAYNALLKTIEEPPEHVIFIFATTEPYKVLPTIISRCQRFDFSKISKKDIVKRLSYIIEKEDIKVAKGVLEQIAILADGGMRDALSILDQCYAYAPECITLTHVFEIYGVITVEEKLHLINYIVLKQVKEAMKFIESLDQRGIDIKRLSSDLIELLKEKVIYDHTSDDTLLDILTKEEVMELQKILSTKDTLEIIDILMDNYEKFRYATNIISYLEIAILKMMDNVSRETSCVESSVIKEPTVESIPTPAKEKTVEIEIPFKEEIIVESPQQVIEKVNNEVETLKEEEIFEEESSTIIQSISEVDNNEEITVNDLSTDLEEPVDFVEPKVKYEEVKSLDDDFVLRLLVGANKDEKSEDKKQMNGIHAYKLDEDTAKYANILAPTEIVASGDTYFIVSTNSQAIANEINALDKEGEFASFVKILFKKSKKVFAINDVQYQRVVDDFKDKYASNTLPEPITISIKEVEEVEKKDETMDGLNILFGSKVTIEE